MSLWIEERNGVPRMFETGREITQEGRRDCSRVMGRYEQLDVVGTLGQTVALLPHFACDLMFGPRVVEQPHSPQHREQLTDAAYLSTELPCPAIDAADLG